MTAQSERPTMYDDFANEIRPPSKTNWLLTIVLVAGAGLAFGWLLHELANPKLPEEPELPHPAVGLHAPKLAVEGWFDDQAVTPDELKGKVYVIDTWGYWCMPCLDAAPHTIELYEKYKDQGVVFFGVTAAERNQLAKSQKFLKLAKFPWRNAFGAADMLLTLYDSDRQMVPQLWVVDKFGIIAWGGHPLALKPEILDRLLAATEPTARPTPAKSPATGARMPSPGG